MGDSGAKFIVEPGTTSLVLGLPADTVITTDFPSLLQRQIERLSVEDQKRLAPLMKGCNIACNPLVCGGLVIQFM
jgi:hypothetical protein